MIIALLGATSASAQESHHAVITSTGTGQAALTPTAAQIRFSIDTRAPSGSAAAEENGARQARMIDVLQRMGLPDNRIQLTSYEVRANMNYQSAKIVDYGASASVTVAVTSLKDIGRVIDSALAAGATEVDRVDFVSDSVPIVREHLLAAAVASARRDAEALAAAVGGKLGPLLNLSTAPCEGSPIDRVTEALALQPGVVGGHTSLADIMPGKISTRVSVCARWQLAT
ncbi:MAG: SIMPL domain-containing protein [Gemmatimonadales bacterium]